MILDWKDDRGMRWTYDASARLIEFADETKPVKTLTVSGWIDRKKAVQNAIAFLDDRGIARTRLGNPYIEPDWIAWWDAEEAAGRCMNADTVAKIRAIASSPSFLLQPPPALSASRTTKCVNPEFPSRIVVRMSATQDGQGIFLGDGTPISGATLYLDAATGEILSGSVMVRSEPDRSDYPAISADEARKRILSGGQGGTPNGDVTIDTIRFEWFLVRDAADTTTAYLYSALVGSGTIRYENATTAPYRIVVPVMKGE
jgi:hypothetical protein